MTPDIHTVLVLDEVGRQIPMKLIQPLYSITYVAVLEAEVAELKKDAERYRWLKENHLQTGKDSWIRTGDDLEEAIDAAMKEAQS